MLFRRWTVADGGVKRYKGNAAEICRQCLEDSWNDEKGYQMVSAGHFKVFYMRDFGWICESMLKLGHKERVKQTLEYALEHYKKKGNITTSINPHGFCFDFPTYSPDSLAYMLRCLFLLKDKKLVEKYKIFLEKEAKRYFEVAIDKETGLIKKKKFSSMKDLAVRQSSCYNNCMSFAVSAYLDKLKLKNPLKKYDFKKIIKKHFWTGEYFLDDLSGSKEITGDSNVFPFWLGVFDDKAMLKKAIASIRKVKLDVPFPLKYCRNDLKEQEMLGTETMAKDYERDAVWMHMGPLYIEIVKRVDNKLAKKYIGQYTRVIEKHKNFLEVFGPKGEVYKTPFYYTDESMSWAANYLTLV
ncbi:MAG: hypothetical protein ABIE94_01025 [archaeon]